MSNEKAEETRAPRIVINRVYTKTGDKGETRLVGGQQVSKDDLRISAYGTVDELNACIGSARISCLDLGLSELASELRRVQNALFNLGSILATLPEDVHPSMPRVGSADVEWLEGSIDRSNEALPSLKSFVLPGGNRANTDLHLARTVCRRAERLCVTLNRAVEGDDGWSIRYLNRLSDALFVWSRCAAIDPGDEEVLWVPGDA